MSVNGRRRQATATSRFGVSRRESHDATEFYARFPTPTISADAHVNPQAARDKIWVGDARAMDDYGDIADSSVALVVTSPPYFAGKEYETAIGEGHVPESYLAYLDMLAGVFAECVRKLEPGGRIAVNVANLGRKPYRSLSADVIGILEGLGLLLRGEVIWVKARASTGSCAWGTFQRPGNPVLRDVTERIVVASKGRFDRAVAARDRAGEGLPSTATISADEFMDLTTDVWEFPSERATLVGHPAPFPVELPRRFVDLYTYEGDLVLDPFMGSGSTAVAALRTGRHFVGFDTDPDYVAQANARIADEMQHLAEEASSTDGPADDSGNRSRPVVGAGNGVVRVHVPAVNDSVASFGATRANGNGSDEHRDAVGTAVRQGRKATDVARLVVEQAGFTDVDSKNIKLKGVPVSMRARDGAGRLWYFDVVGAFANGQAGLRRKETLWKALGKVSVLRAVQPDLRLVLLTTDVPPPGSVPGKALDALLTGGSGSEVSGTDEAGTFDEAVFDVVEMLDDGDRIRLQHHAGGRTPAAASDETAAETARRGPKPPRGRKAEAALTG